LSLEDAASKLLDALIAEMKHLASGAKVKMTIDRDFDEPIAIESELDPGTEERLWRYLNLAMSIAFAIDSLRDRVYKRLREVGEVEEISDLDKKDRDDDDLLL